MSGHGLRRPQARAHVVEFPRMGPHLAQNLISALYIEFTYEKYPDF